jgi:type I restriction enzyme S subunit
MSEHRAIGSFAKQIKRTNETQSSNADVYSVTKYDGFVRSLDYFKKQVFSRDLSSYKIVRKGEFAYSTIHLDEGALGLLGDEEALISPMYTTFEVDESVDKIYLSYLLRSPELVSQYGLIGQGSVNRRKSVPFSSLAEIEVFTPPLPEQKKIAEILSGIQEKKDAGARQISKVNYLEKCLLSSIFSQGEGEEWKRVSVSDIGRVIRGASPRPKGDPRYYGGRVPRLMGADVTRDGKYVIPSIDFLTEAGAKLSRPVPAGTLTIVCSGVVGVPSILSVDACIHDGFLAIVDISPECMTDYLFYYFKPLRQLLDSSATHGGIFTNLTTEILKDFPVSLPPLEKQREIVSDLRSIDSCRNSLIAKEKKIEFLLNSISSDLLSGRKRVSV